MTSHKPSYIIGELSNVATNERKVQMESLWLALYWGSPIGLGVFLAGLGVLLFLVEKAKEIEKRRKGN